MTDSDFERQVCSHCHLPAVPILYGYPSGLGADLMHIGRLVGGGCVISHDAPTFACPHRHQWRPGDESRSIPPAVDEDPLLAAARLYLAGDLAEAEQAYRSAARNAGETLGETHPDALALRYAVAIVLYQAGRLAEGEAEYRAMWAASGRPLRAGPVPTLEELKAAIERRNRLADRNG